MNTKKVSEAFKVIAGGFSALADAIGELPQQTTSVMDDEAPATMTNGSGKKVKKEKAEPKVEAKEEKKSEITEDQLRTALVEYAQANSKEGAYAILGKYGAKKVNELKKEDFPRVLAELEM